MSKVTKKYYGNEQSQHNPEHANQYLHNLTQQIAYLKSALEMAEDLINTYQKQNQSLQKQKQNLESNLSGAQHKIHVLQQVIKNTHYNQKQLAQLSERIAILTELNRRNSYQIEERDLQIKQLQSLLSDKNKQRLNSIQKNMNNFRKQFISKNLDISENWHNYEEKLRYISKNPKLTSVTQRNNIKYKKLKDGKILSHLQTTMFETDEQNPKANSITGIKTATSIDYTTIKNKTSRSGSTHKVWK